MSWLEAVVLALIQGVTEFLPISSSAHLILVPHVFGWADQGLAFDVAVHVGTLLAVVAYFRKRLAAIACGLMRCGANADARDAQLGWKIAAAVIPVSLAGLLLHDWVEQSLRSPLVIAATTIGFGLLLWWSDAAGSRARDHDALGWRDAVWIGLAQVLALVPGTSRSGVTMTAGLMLGLNREAAAQFSFLLAVPVIALAGGYETWKLLHLEGAVPWPALGIGVAVSAVTAYATIHFFLQWITRAGFLPFVLYRLALGAVLLVLYG